MSIRCDIFSIYKNNGLNFNKNLGKPLMTEENKC